MKITIAHNQSKQAVMESVDHSLDNLFQGHGLPVRLTLQHRSWQGSTLSFALTAKMGFISSPIRGTIEVTDQDLILDVDLGLLGRLVSEKTAREVLGQRVHGLLE